MTAIDQTPYGKLDAEGRLLSPVFKGATKKAGRFGFRGELAIKFIPQVADESRPPEMAVGQCLSTAKDGKFEFLSGFLQSFGYLGALVELLGDALHAGGKYVLFCDNIDLADKYTCTINGVAFTILPIDEAMVYNETLDLFDLERSDLKKLSDAEKLDAIADAALSFKKTYKAITFEEGLKLMGPVRDPMEGRPV